MERLVAVHHGVRHAHLEYRSAVRASGASHYWRLDETGGATELYDDVGDAPGTATSLTLGAAGPSPATPTQPSRRPAAARRR